MLQQRATMQQAQEAIKSGKKVIIDFFADWCGPCQMFGPVFHAHAESNEEIYITINSDEQPEFMAKSGVESIPTVHVYEGGELINKANGFMPPEALAKFVKGK